MKPKLLKNSASIIGAWKLISFEIQKKNGEVTYPFGKNVQGSIIYTDSGRFSAQVMRPDLPKFASGDQMKGTAEEIKANYEGCVSYYGHYKFDSENNIVIHHVEGSLFPNWEGNEIVAILIWEHHR
jgi:hypothetical protein